MTFVRYILIGLLSLVLISCSGETRSATYTANDCKDDRRFEVDCQYDNDYDDRENYGNENHDDSSIFTWEYAGFTHSPVDLSEFFSDAAVEFRRSP